MRLKKIASTVLGTVVMIFAAANVVGFAATADMQTINAGSSDTVITDHNMAHFLAVVADEIDNGDDRRYWDGGNRHQRHFALGFAHGKSNGNDECRANGHLVGNDFGHTDCGEPSPSD